MRVLITGGAGFVGSNLAKLFKAQNPSAEIVVFDNLKRRGSELNLPEFKKRGIRFVQGDVRYSSDFQEIAACFDVMIEASAEPSVTAGLDGSPDYLLQTNLLGTMHCLEFARKHVGQLVFLSSSRVYSMAPLRAIPLQEAATRFELAAKIPASLRGLSEKGIAEDFPTDSARSLYGATKLASEILIQEYAHAYKLKAMINRCGVIAGPGQFGKVDQGVFTLWMANHYFGKPLQYTGYEGKGKQVRDLLHPKDLFSLIQKQLAKPETFTGEVFNVGGGKENSVSLLELTKLCQEISGKKITIGSSAQSHGADIPYFVTDSSKASQVFDWQPTQNVQTLMQEIHRWIQSHEADLKPLFG